MPRKARGSHRKQHKYKFTSESRRKRRRNLTSTFIHIPLASDNGPHKKPMPEVYKNYRATLRRSSGCDIKQH